jgi:hypothetical protein
MLSTFYAETGVLLSIGRILRSSSISIADIGIVSGTGVGIFFLTLSLAIRITQIL